MDKIRSPKGWGMRTVWLAIESLNSGYLFFSINTTEIVLKAKLSSLGGEGVSGRSWGRGVILAPEVGRLWPGCLWPPAIPVKGSRPTPPTFAVPRATACPCHSKFLDFSPPGLSRGKGWSLRRMWLYSSSSSPSSVTLPPSGTQTPKNSFTTNTIYS